MTPSLEGLTPTKQALVKIVNRFMIDPKLQMFKPMVCKAITDMDAENVNKLIDTLDEVLTDLKQANEKPKLEAGEYRVRNAVDLADIIDGSR